MLFLVADAAVGCSEVEWATSSDLVAYIDIRQFSCRGQRARLARSKKRCWARRSEKCWGRRASGEVRHLRTRVCTRVDIAYPWQTVGPSFPMHWSGSQRDRDAGRSSTTTVAITDRPISASEAQNQLVDLWSEYTVDRAHDTKSGNVGCTNIWRSSVTENLWAEKKHDGTKDTGCLI